MRVRNSDRSDWLAPLAASAGFVVLVCLFGSELKDYQRAVIGWAERDLAVRTELAASTLSEALRTSDFRRIHAFGDDCAAEGVRLTVFSGSGGVFFDSLKRGGEEPEALYESQPCGEFTVRLGLPISRVLAPVERARRGLILAAGLGGCSVLVFFFFFYRQRVRIRELARVEKFRREFISDVSHEIRTPLTGILGAVDLLAGDSPLIPLIRKEARRLNGLVQSILDLSRLERDEGALHPAATDLSALMSELAEEQKCAAKIAPGVSVHADAQLIEQAVLNLIANAKRHSGTTDITVALEVSAATVRLIVEDHGIGIPPEHRARVFERFHRIDPARASETGGAGLGLAIVRRIARLHGGDVTLEPAHPSGCRFTITLPR
ncbi:MAG: sensor histidine kinase [Kiritimatiellia bacterium]